MRILRRRGFASVAHLAGELEVSRRTVLRDLAHLRNRGFNILAEGGPGGGVYLDPDSVLLSSQLAVEEVVALVLSVAVMRAAPWIPFAAGAERALAKIEGALPAERVRELRRFMHRILVGDPAERGAALSADGVDPSFLSAFELGVHFQPRAALRLRGPRGPPQPPARRASWAAGSRTPLVRGGLGSRQGCGPDFPDGSGAPSHRTAQRRL
jgi:hypothetical protein